MSNAIVAPGKLMSNLPPSADDVVDAIHVFAADQLEKGTPHTDIQELLVERGLDHSLAARVIANLLDADRAAKHAVGRQNMMFGAIWCVGGIAVTLATRASATGGGVYIVAWGAIIVGGIQFFRGVLQCNS